MTRYLKIWWHTALLSFQTALANRLGAAFFTPGKFLRFGLFIFFLSVLRQRLDQLSGYTFSQILTFFLIFNLFDLFGQIFFRGIYWFRDKVVSGQFDFNLLKPISALFQVLTSHTDILDLPLLGIVVFMLLNQPLSISFTQGVSFLLISLSALVVITAIHISVAALGVITTEVDHTIMIYRDLSQMARVPIDIYTDTIRSLLTFAIPVALAFTFPAKALLGLLAPTTIALALVGSMIFFYLSIKLWRLALSQYSSASS